MLVANFEKVYHNSPVFLAEAAIVERLKREFSEKMDVHVNHAGLIYSGSSLKTIYKQYIDIARQYDFPIILMTPTRKVNVETHRQSVFASRDLLSDAYHFLDDIRNEYSDFKHKIFIGGQLGCRGDAYSATEALNREDAYQFHKKQVSLFAKTQVDFLFAGIMPAISEAMGMAQAMAESLLPYIISFMIRRDGRLIDGTSISEAIRLIDNEIRPFPLSYMTNCVHPTNLMLALESECNRNTTELNRFVGIQANSSCLSPEELNNCGILQQGNFDEMVSEIMVQRQKFNFKIYGGCCGSDHVYLEKLAKSLRGKVSA